MINLKFKIIYSALSKVELQEAVLWYNKQKKYSGKKLKADVKNTVGKIIQNPNFTSVKYDTTHVAALRTFPYTIHYEIDFDNKLIRIISIFHTSRKPKWED
jgi:plasmid stabilization system protein ParE